MIEVRTSELVAGSDSEFVTNAYCALLGRLPEPAGFNHYTTWLQREPDARPAALKHIASSQEFKNYNQVTYIEDDSSGVEADDPKVLLSAMQRFQWPILRSMVSRTFESVHLVGANLEQAISDLLFDVQKSGGGGRGGGSNLDFDVDARVAQLESEFGAVKAGVEGIQAGRREMTRNLTDHFVNLLQVQLMAIDERLARLETRLGAR
ncbi:MAG: DUF4214 domain-containing protein [Caulobacteraceae bacterium]